MRNLVVLVAMVACSIGCWAQDDDKPGVMVWKMQSVCEKNLCVGTVHFPEGSELKAVQIEREGENFSVSMVVDFPNLPGLTTEELFAPVDKKTGKRIPLDNIRKICFQSGDETKKPSCVDAPPKKKAAPSNRAAVFLIIPVTPRRGWILNPDGGRLQ
ncbi:MAG TPA: hypothetical protein VMU07_01265 [Candidatus Paceibacterota bacterium]|nr:hypothetical protein [Candidatus Paceibacterota bacterium]